MFKSLNGAEVTWFCVKEKVRGSFGPALSTLSLCKATFMMSASFNHDIDLQDINRYYFSFTVMCIAFSNLMGTNF